MNNTNTNRFHKSPSSSSPLPTAHCPLPSSIHTITKTLLEDLFNPSISTLDLCNLHQISLPKLADLLESETFKQAKSAFERINAARQKIIDAEASALATARLADILKDKPTTPAHAETQRKAATKILTSSSPSLVGRASSPSSPVARFSTPSSPTIPSSRLPRASGGRWHAQRDGGGLLPLSSSSNTSALQQRCPQSRRRSSSPIPRTNPNPQKKGRPNHGRP